MQSNACPARKLRYRFTCFVSRGDVDDPSNCSYEADPLPTISEVVPEVATSVPKRADSSDKEGSKETAGGGEEALVERGCAKHDVTTDPAEAEERERERLRVEGYLSRDGDDPFVYSTQIATGPRSSLSAAATYDPKSPPPVYLSDLELMSCTKRTKEEFLAGFAIPAEGGLLCVDQDILQRQSGIISDMLKQLFTKLSVDRISLPVRIFEPRSTCERVIDLWRFAPYYLNNAAASRDKIDRFKQVIAFAVAGMYCSAQQLKPFNPLIGETLEGHFEDGTQVYVEHISHHPPVSQFLMVGPDSSYKMHGYYEYKIRMSANTLEGQQDGPNVVEFGNGQKIVFRYPKVKIHGTVFGKRTIYPSGVMTFEDERNRLRAVIVFNYGKKRRLFGSRKKGTKIDDIEGIIYYAKKGLKQPKIAEIKQLTDVELPVAHILGSWLHNLKIGGTTFWDIDRVQPYVLQYTKDPLPSDWRFREDLIWLRRNDLVVSQEWKTRLEVEQRRVEKLRTGK